MDRVVEQVGEHLAHALQRNELLCGQPVEIRRALDEPAVDENGDPFLAEGVDLEAADGK